MKNIKALLAIERFEVTGNQLTILQNSFKNDPDAGEGLLKRDENEFFDILPEYFINGDGELRDIEDVEWDDNDNKIVLVRAWTADALLQEEISNIGLKHLFNGIDLRPVLEKLRKFTIEDLKSLCTYAEYLIVDMCYSKYWTDCGYEYDFEASIDDVLQIPQPTHELF